MSPVAADAASPDRAPTWEAGAVDEVRDAGGEPECELDEDEPQAAAAGTIRPAARTWISLRVMSSIVRIRPENLLNACVGGVHSGGYWAECRTRDCSCWRTTRSSRMSSSGACGRRASRREVWAPRLS